MQLLGYTFNYRRDASQFYLILAVAFVGFLNKLIFLHFIVQCFSRDIELFHGLLDAAMGFDQSLLNDTLFKQSYLISEALASLLVIILGMTGLDFTKQDKTLGTVSQLSDIASQSC